MTVLNTSYSYVNITKYTADSADNSPNILHPECSIIQYAKQKENIYAFRVCYRDRASLNEEIKGKNRLLINKATLSKFRTYIVSQWIRDALEGNITLGTSRHIEQFFDWIDKNGLSDRLEVPEGIEAIYKSYTEHLYHLIRLSKAGEKKGIKRGTAFGKQKAARLIAHYATGKQQAVIEHWAPYIHSNKNRQAPQPRLHDHEVPLAAELHLRFFNAYTNCVLNNLPKPLVIDIDDLGFPKLVIYSSGVHSHNDWGEKSSLNRSPQVDVRWMKYAFTRDGLIPHWPAVRALAEKDGIILGSSGENNQASKQFVQAVRAHKGSFNSYTQRLFANRAALHFGHLLLYYAGLNASHLDSIDFSKTRLDKELGSNRIVAIKGRSLQEAQSHTLDSRFVHTIWKQYLQLREWMVRRAPGHVADEGIFTLPTEIGNSVAYVESDKLRSGIFWPEGGPSLATRVAKKYKTTSMLEDTKGDIALVALATSTSVRTVEKHYSFKTAEDASRELTVFFNAMMESARLRVSGKAEAPVTGSGKKIPVGRCTGETTADTKQIAGFDERAPKPRCGAPLTCFFCESFGFHADEQDILRILSVKEWIIYQSQDKSRNVDEHAKKFLPIIYRIDEIISAFTDRDKASLSVVEQARQRISLGILDPYWNNKINALIDTIEA